MKVWALAEIRNKGYEDAVVRYLDRLLLMNPDKVLRARIADIRAELRGQHGPTGEQCIADELVACTLGRRVRPELEVL